MQSASRRRRRRSGSWQLRGPDRAPCVLLQALTALPLSAQNDPRTTPTRCDATRRDADFGKCNCNLLKFVAAAAAAVANRETNRRRRRKRRQSGSPEKPTQLPKIKKNPTGAIPTKSFGHVFCHAFVLFSAYCALFPAPGALRQSPETAAAVNSHSRHSFRGLPHPLCSHAPLLVFPAPPLLVLCGHFSIFPRGTLARRTYTLLHLPKLARDYNGCDATDFFMLDMD